MNTSRRSARNVTRMATVMALILSLALGITGLVMAASVGIDTFDEGLQNITADPDVTSNSGYVNTTQALGGQRDVAVYWTSGLAAVSLQVDRFGSNQLKFNQESGALGWGEVVWDGTDNNATALNTTGLGGVDLTDGGKNNGIQLLVYECDGGFDLTIEVYDNDDGSKDSYVLTISSAVAAPGQSFFIPFSAFTGDGTSFDSAGAVRFKIVPTANSVDLTLDLFEATANTDWGDLPDSYKTLSSNDGARHTKGSLWLGSTVDLEADGIPDVNAAGDDSNNYDDEDGITLDTSDQWLPGNTVHFTANVTGGNGDLYAWFDWDNDGDFSDETPQSWTGLTPGAHVLSLTVPQGFNPSNGLNARFRLVPANATAPNYYGVATDGEVEDYHWTFNPTAVTFAKVSATPVAGGLSIALMGIVLAGAGAISLLATRRRKM